MKGRRGPWIDCSRCTLASFAGPGVSELSTLIRVRCRPSGSPAEYADRVAEGAALRRRPMYPVFSVHHAFMHVATGDGEAIESWLDAAERALAEPLGSSLPRADTDDRRTLPATIAVYRGSLARPVSMWRARGDTPGAPSIWRGIQPIALRAWRKNYTASEAPLARPDLTTLGCLNDFSHAPATPHSRRDPLLSFPFAGPHRDGGHRTAATS